MTPSLGHHLTTKLSGPDNELLSSHGPLFNSFLLRGDYGLQEHRGLDQLIGEETAARELEGFCGCHSWSLCWICKREDFFLRKPTCVLSNM